MNKVKKKELSNFQTDRMGSRHLVSSVALNNHGAFLNPVFFFNWSIIILVGLQSLMERMIVAVLEKLVNSIAEITSERGSVLILSAEDILYRDAL